MLTELELHRIAREAEVAYATVIDQVEQELDTTLDRLKYVRFTIDRKVRAAKWAQEPYSRRYPDLCAKPLWTLDELSADVVTHVRSLVDSFTEVRNECRRAAGQVAFEPGMTGHLGLSKDWRQLVVLRQDLSFTDETPQVFPLLSCISQRMRLEHAIGMVYFALMRPGANLDNHCGGTNAQLRVHIGLHVPLGDVGISVGGSTLRWQNGAALVFDDTYGHEAWNNTDRERLVLLLRVPHPDLSIIERIALERAQAQFALTTQHEDVLRALRGLSALQR